MDSLSGRIRRVRFQKAFWCVAEFDVSEGEHKGTVVITGDLPGIRLGDTCDLFGDWVEDAKFGRQFKVKKSVQKERSGVELFLQEMPGIGPVKAKQIRELFGDQDVFDVIAKKPDELRKIAGLTDAKIKAIHSELVARKIEIDLFVKCQALGLSPYIIGKIKQHFTDNGPAEIRGLPHKVAEYALAAVQTDPYKLVEVDGIGFLTADKIAQKVGIKGDNPSRCWAAIDWVLKEIEESEGSSIIDANMMLAALKGRERGPGGEQPPVKLAPAVPEDLIYSVLANMAKIGRVIVTDKWIQRRAARECEQSIAAEIAMRFGVSEAVRGQTDFYDKQPDPAATAEAAVDALRRIAPAQPDPTPASPASRFADPIYDNPPPIIEDDLPF